MARAPTIGSVAPAATPTTYRGNAPEHDLAKLAGDGEHLFVQRQLERAHILARLVQSKRPRTHTPRMQAPRPRERGLPCLQLPAEKAMTYDAGELVLERARLVRRVPHLDRALRTPAPPGSTVSQVRAPGQPTGTRRTLPPVYTVRCSVPIARAQTTSPCGSCRMRIIFRGRVGGLSGAVALVASGGPVGTADVFGSSRDLLHTKGAGSADVQDRERRHIGGVLCDVRNVVHNIRRCADTDTGTST